MHFHFSQGIVHGRRGFRKRFVHGNTIWSWSGCQKMGADILTWVKPTKEESHCGSSVQAVMMRCLWRHAVHRAITISSLSSSFVVSENTAWRQLRSSTYEWCAYYWLASVFAGSVTELCDITKALCLCYWRIIDIWSFFFSSYPAKFPFRHRIVSEYIILLMVAYVLCCRYSLDPSTFRHETHLFH